MSGGHTTIVHPPRIVRRDRPSHLYNRYTQAHFNWLRQRQTNFNYSVNVRGWLDGRRSYFRNQYNVSIYNRSNRYVNFYLNNAYRYGYSAYYDHGFCGGYYYPVRPWINIEQYFYYPVIYWLYDDRDDSSVSYYQEWYGVDYPSYPVTPFSFAGVFFPTESLRDMAMEVSAMPAATQYQFRQSLEQMLNALTDRASEILGEGFELGDNDVVIDHYENLSDRAIVVEGFIDRGDIHLPFKGVLNLEYVDSTAIFIPSGEVPTEGDLADLAALNQMIVDLGGDPFTVQGEPEPLPAPTPN